MAKQSFKDMIFKLLRKDEDEDAPANALCLINLKKTGILAKGGLTKEDAPANATGTAGTGDDSSTVVVKKEKKITR